MLPCTIVLYGAVKPLVPEYSESKVELNNTVWPMQGVLYAAMLNYS